MKKHPLPEDYKAAKARVTGRNAAVATRERGEKRG